MLHRGRVVTSDAVIDALWPAGAPRDPKPALQTHLSRLRKRLPGIVSSTDAGYRLDATAVSLDADVLAAAVAAAATDPQAADTIAATLARWRGPAYPELADDDDGRAEATRLEELRILATERHAEARLIAGATDGLVVELAALADEHPLRERPRALLMEALAAEGRTADALRVFDDFRRVLGDELGIEPSGGSPPSTPRCSAGPSVAAWTPPHRLPVAATSLVGRDELVDDAISLVGDHRLVTLVGPGGVGKSRLAIEVGHRLRASGRPGPSCSSSWRPPRRTRPSTRSRPRWASTAGRASALDDRLAGGARRPRGGPAARQLRARPRTRSAALVEAAGGDAART